MELLDIILLSLIQGLTEWLPISSSGHLVLAQELFNMQVPIYYDILLHFATLIVILLVFYKDIYKIIKELLKLNFKNEYAKLGIYIIIASIPTAIIGFTFKDLFLSFYTNINAVAISLLITGLILLSTKFFHGKRKLTTFDSILIGVAQGLAIIPGISRSGSTISTSLILGIRKELAIKFSFLLAIPAILGATILEYTPAAINLEILLGIFITIITGYLSLKLTINLILKDKFHYFSIYCFILGIIILII
ncbi:undecaprenyl-diphosphate phosphatase [archaeon]|jgi:undecaprenyl-diphosphatase|nr:undecaprenyl-diphosphate phosphatase [archaeon]MBT3730740.1 undecaprenyl-diphosphate phosphatase [archaeon]MBT4669642.1 undecaprenyl-diphosphate phosphatase [archaeon]MBT5030399.1 undecaprenyl-diphosphate phosphatase [archaeon]MBT5288308.1 undecaprenyl-diphosphate phosphatase [archaeon]